MPKSKRDFWLPKLSSNKRRDKAVLKELDSMNWQVFVVWECELKDRDKLAKRIKSFMERP